MVCSSFFCACSDIKEATTTREQSKDGRSPVGPLASPLLLRLTALAPRLLRDLLAAAAGDPTRDALQVLIGQQALAPRGFLGRLDAAVTRDDRARVLGICFEHRASPLAGLTSFASSWPPSCDHIPILGPGPNPSIPETRDHGSDSQGAGRKAHGRKIT